jgi:hypothetical protein
LRPVLGQALKPVKAAPHEADEARVRWRPSAWIVTVVIAGVAIHVDDSSLSLS